MANGVAPCCPTLPPVSQLFPVVSGGHHYLDHAPLHPELVDKL